MNRRFSIIAVSLAFSVFLVACATPSGTYDPYKSAAAGTLGGAALGAAFGSAIGAATGSAGKGAWIGAAAGGVLGGVGGAIYAAHQNSAIRSPDQAAAAYQYSGHGNIISIDAVSASPTSVHPGQKINFGMEYTILAPNNTPVAVTLVREIRYNNTPIGSPHNVTVTNLNGSYKDSIEYTVNNNAYHGNYTVLSRVSNSYGTTQKEAYFTVQ